MFRIYPPPPDEEILSAINKKTLLIDADPQGNASTGIGISYENRSPNLYDLIVNESLDLNAIKKLSLVQQIIIKIGRASQLLRNIKLSILSSPIFVENSKTWAYIGKG